MIAKRSQKHAASGNFRHPRIGFVLPLAFLALQLAAGTLNAGPNLDNYRAVSVFSDIAGVPVNQYFATTGFELNAQKQVLMKTSAAGSERDQLWRRETDGDWTLIAGHNTSLSGLPFNGIYYGQMNDLGDVVFSAIRHNQPSHQGVFRYDSNITAVQSSTNYSAFHLQIDNGNRIAWTLSELAVYVEQDGTTQRMDDLPFINHMQWRDSPVLAATGEVYFHAEGGPTNEYKSAIVYAGPGTPKIIYGARSDQTTYYREFGIWSINSSGLIALSGRTGSGNEVSLLQNGTIIPVFNATGTEVLRFEDIELHDDGTIITLAALDSGKEAIYTGTTSLSRFFGPGDSFPDSPLHDLVIVDINENFDILFRGKLPNGASAYMIATPVPEPSEFALFLTAFMTIGLTWCVRRRGNRFTNS